MAETVVDDLKPVEIKEQHGETRVVITLGTIDRLFEMVHERDAVWQIGQRVVQSVIAKLFFGTTAFGNVAETRDAADSLALKILRLRIAFDQASVRQLKYLSDRFVGRVVSRFEPFEKFIGLNQFTGDVFHEGRSVFFLDDRRIEFPHLHKFVVARDDLTVETHDDDAVGGRFECGGEKRQRFVERCFGTAAFADVAGDALDADRHTIIHDQTRAQIERYTRAVFGDDL